MEAITITEHYHGQLSGDTHFHQGQVKVVGEDVTEEVAKKLVKLGKAVPGVPEVPEGEGEAEEAAKAEGKTLPEAVNQANSKGKRK